MTIPIIQDDREKKKSWDQEYLGPEFKVERKRLQTGDYTIRGMEDIVCIEKKASWEEIVGNIKTRKAKRRILAEFERMQQYPIRILGIHDELSTIGQTQFYGAPIPTGNIYQFVMDTALEYGIFVFNFGNYYTSQSYVRQMFKTLWNYDKNGRLYSIKSVLQSLTK